MESPSLEQAPPSDGLRGARMAVLFGLLFAALAHSDRLSIQPERPRVLNLKGAPLHRNLLQLALSCVGFSMDAGFIHCSSGSLLKYECFPISVLRPGAETPA